jgi:MFS transporter, DHA1 family, tetracycline resistance protein
MAAAGAAPSFVARFGVSRAMALILFTVFLDLLGIGLIFPIGPFYAGAFGANAFEVGLLFTSYSVAQFLTIPILGALSDRLGRRPVLLSCIAGEAVGYLLFGTAGSLGMLYVSRVVAGASSGNIGAAQAYMADITRPRERTRSFGLLGAAISVGFLFGPVVGGFLGGINLRLPAFVAAGLVVINCVSAIVWLPESLPAERRTRASLVMGANPFGVLGKLLRRPLLRAPLVATFLCNFAFSGYLATFALFASARFGFGPENVAIVLVVQSALSIIMQTVGVRRLSEALPDTTIVQLGAALSLLGFVVIALAPSPWVLYVVSAPLHAGGSSLWRSALSSLITKLVSPREQGMANGGGQATQALATIVGPMWAGASFEQLGTASPFLAGAAMFGLAGVTIATAVRRQPHLRVSPAEAHGDALGH